MRACGLVLGTAQAQSAGGALPAAVLTAKTVAVVNDTRDSQLTKGAEQALASWGQFQVVGDADLADITLRFDKTKERGGTSTQGTDPTTSKPDYGYSVSVSSSIHLKAYLKDGDAPFFCDQDGRFEGEGGHVVRERFPTAYRTARQ